MKKKLFWLGLVVCIFCLIRIDAVAQDGKWKWVRASGTTEAAYTNSVATDSKENVYVGGGYSSKITFGTYTLKGNIYQNIFIAKYDSMGRVLWAKTNEGGNYYDVATSIITDDSGFIYLCGYFRSAYLKFDT
ncbi:MAG: hypothetical protein NTX03_00015, partial [Bacteroidetes bacterium]|nr:hypothetical protein [Bacteroidota bacterium]